MRAMKESGIPWIGETPDDWCVDRIKHHFSVVSGATPKSDNPEFWDGDIPWITPADYKTEDKYVSCGRKRLSEAGYSSCGTTLVPSGSIIFSKRAPVGTVAIANSKLCTNQGCLSCVVKDGSNTTFYYYAMSAFKEQFELMATGTTFKEIAADVFANFYLPTPPRIKQDIIVRFLDAECARIDAVMEQTRESIEEYKKLKQSIITEAVTKGIRPNRPMKYSGIDWIRYVPSSWEVRPIKNSFTIVSGATPKSDNPNYWDGNIAWITPADYKFDDKYITAGKRNLTIAGYDSCGTTMVPKGSIVFSKRAPIGTVAIAGEQLCTNQGCLSCVPKQDVCSEYFYYTIAAFEEQYNLYGTGTTFKEISFTAFSDFKLPLPPYEEQVEIAEWLDQECNGIDDLINKKKRLLTIMESYKKSLIFEYVTGKKEVR